MAEEENGKRRQYNENILSFVEKVKQRREEEIGRTLAPLAECIGGFAHAFSEMHRHATLCGARFSDAQQLLLEKGAHPDSVAVIRMYVNGAQDAFADEIAQGAFESTLMHFAEAASRLEEMLRGVK